MNTYFSSGSQLIMDAIFFSFTKPFPSQGWQELIFERVAKTNLFCPGF